MSTTKTVWFGMLHPKFFTWILWKIIPFDMIWYERIGMLGFLFVSQ